MFVGPETTVSWRWKKPEGKTGVLQLTVVNPQTGAWRYLGYGVGSITESVSSDPTIEIFISADLPAEWTKVERNLRDDIKSILGWDSAKVTEVFFCTWDDKPVAYAQAII